MILKAVRLGQVFGPWPDHFSSEVSLEKRPKTIFRVYGWEVGVNSWLLGLTTFGLLLTGLILSATSGPPHGHACGEHVRGLPPFAPPYFRVLGLGHSLAPFGLLTGQRTSSPRSYHVTPCLHRCLPRPSLCMHIVCGSQIFVSPLTSLNYVKVHAASHNRLFVKVHFIHFYSYATVYKSQQTPRLSQKQYQHITESLPTTPKVWDHDLKFT